MAICIFKLLNLFAEISILYLDSWRLVRVWLWRHTPPFGHHLWSTVHVLFALQLFLFRSLFAGRLLFIYIFHPDTAIQSIHLEIYHGHQNTTNERTRIHDVSSFRRFVNHQTITIMFTRNTTTKNKEQHIQDAGIIRCMLSFLSSNRKTKPKITKFIDNFNSIFCLNVVIFGIFFCCC